MFTKEEASAFKKEFWSGFENHMKRHKSAGGYRVNWIQYKTNVKHLYFRMETDDKTIRLCIDHQHPDDDIRELFYEQFEEVKAVLESQFEDSLTWNPEHVMPTGQVITRISIEEQNLNIFNKEDWSNMWAFFQRHLIHLDAFWVEFQELFFALK